MTMPEIIPGLPDIAHSTTLDGSEGHRIELFVPGSFFHRKRELGVLEDFLDYYATQILLTIRQNCELEGMSDKPLDGFIMPVLSLGVEKSMRTFLKAFFELPKLLQTLILHKIPTCRTSEGIKHMMNWVFTYAEMQELELEFPGQLSACDYVAAFEEPQGWYHPTRHIRARLTGELLF